MQNYTINYQISWPKERYFYFKLQQKQHLLYKQKHLYWEVKIAFMKGKIGFMKGKIG